MQQVGPRAHRAGHVHDRRRGRGHPHRGAGDRRVQRPQHRGRQGRQGDRHASRCSNVGWQEALRTMLRSNGLDYVEDGGILRVDERDQAARRDGRSARPRSAKQLELVPLETRIVKLNYANAARAARRRSQPALTKRGSDPGREAHQLADRQRPVERTSTRSRRWRCELDSTTPQIEITAKLVDVDAEALRGIGIEWNVGGDRRPDGRSSSTARRRSPPRRALDPATTATRRSAASTTRRSPTRRRAITYGIFKDWGFDRGAAAAARAEPQGQHHLEPAHHDGGQPRGQDPGRPEDSAHRPGRRRQPGVAAADHRHPAQGHAAPDAGQEDHHGPAPRGQRPLDARARCRAASSSTPAKPTRA